VGVRAKERPKLASVVLQGVSVQFAQHESATWGKPFILSSAGIELGLF
jgi:hypothetical protein